MGFFKNVFKKPKNVFRSATKVVQTAIKNPVRASLAVTSMGQSEALRAAPVVGKLYQKAVNVAEVGHLTAANVYTGGAIGQAQNLLSSLTGDRGATPMALNLGNILGTASKVFGGNQNPYFQAISNVSTMAGAFIPQQAAIRAPSVPMTRPGVPMVRPGVSMARGFFNKFPNLSASLAQLRARGMSVKRSQLYRMLKRFGPELLITGGLLTAAAVNELLIAGPGHRRMNAANAKALRRAARRIKAFHGLCGTADLLKSRGRRSSGKCGSCRKSPCKC